MAKNWAEVAQKWKDRAGSASAQKEWLNGVQGVQGSPTHKAAAAIPKYVQNVLAAVESGRLNQSLMAVSEQQWKQQCAAKQGNFQRGVAAAGDKSVAFFTSFGPMLEAAAAQVRQMPKMTIEDSKARSNAMIDAAHALKGRWRGR